jgi:hypothetical protein
MVADLRRYATRGVQTFMVAIKARAANKQTNKQTNKQNLLEDHTRGSSSDSFIGAVTWM